MRVAKQITGRWHLRHVVQPEEDHMKYVSAQWVVSPYGGPSYIKAIGDDGVEYALPSADSDVPPWPEYLAEGGTIAPIDTGSAANENITNAPDNLTGGPLIKEVFNVHD